LFNGRIKRVHVDVDDLANPPFVHWRMWYLTMKSTTSIASLSTSCDDSNIDPSEGGVGVVPKKKPPVSQSMD
jgi:hypothetical protein